MGISYFEEWLLMLIDVLGSVAAVCNTSQEEHSFIFSILVKVFLDPEPMFNSQCIHESGVLEDNYNDIKRTCKRPHRQGSELGSRTMDM